MLTPPNRYSAAMRNFALLLSVLLPALLPWAAAAQGAKPLAPRNQFALGVGIYSGEISYARRLGESPLSVGAGLWGAWEPPNSFNRNVWEPLGLAVFGRLRPLSWLHSDVGLAGARYLWADDCSECSGTFVGVRSAVLAGCRILAIGPEVALGRVSDERYGADFGAMWGVQARLMLGWGR
jgi:hypothetical protein